MNYPKIIIYNYNQLFDILNELSDELNLEFNKARQTAITTEMLEIVGGAEALTN